MPVENIVERMRRDIRIQKTKGNAFEIAFASSDPAKAQRATRALLDSVVALRVRIGSALAYALWLNGRRQAV